MTTDSEGWDLSKYIMSPNQIRAVVLEQNRRVRQRVWNGTFGSWRWWFGFRLINPPTEPTS